MRALARTEPNSPGRTRPAFKATSLLSSYETRTERECFSVSVSTTPDEIITPVGIYVDGVISEDFFTRSETIRQFTFMACFHTDSMTRKAALNYLGPREVSEIFSIVEGSKYSDTRAEALAYLESSFRKGTNFGICPRSTYLLSCLSREPEMRSRALQQLSKEPFWGCSGITCMLLAGLHTKFSDTANEAAELAAKRYGAAEPIVKSTIGCFLALARPLVLLKDWVVLTMDSWRKPSNSDIRDCNPLE